MRTLTICAYAIIVNLVFFECSVGANDAAPDARFAARVGRRFLDLSTPPSLNRRLRNTYWDAVRHVRKLQLERAKAAMIAGGATLDYENKPEHGPAFAQFIICKGPKPLPGATQSYIRISLTDMGPGRAVYVEAEIETDFKGTKATYDQLSKTTGYPDGFAAKRVLLSQDCRRALENQNILGVKTSYGPFMMLGLPYSGFGFSVVVDREPDTETILHYFAASGYDPVYVGSRISTKANGRAVRDDVFLEVEKKDRIIDANGTWAFWKD